MIAQRTAQTIATRAKRLARRKRRDLVLQALQRVVAAKRASTPVVSAGPRRPPLGATIHEIHKALPELQHAQIGRELERACRQLAVEVVGDKWRGQSRIRFWALSKCQVCGCDELRACSHNGEPCSWVSLNLCSRCAP